MPTKNNLQHILLLLANRIRIHRIISIIIFFFCFVVFTLINKLIVPELNYSKFKETYTNDLISVLMETSFELVDIEFTELIPDTHKDYYTIERINEYEVNVYVKGTPPEYEIIFNILKDIHYRTNHYLLSNTYKMLSVYAYLDDDSKETGFHEIIANLIFEDSSSYRIRYYTTLEKNGEKVWQQKQQPVTEESMAVQADASGWDCMYTDCDSPRAKGRLYCHIHACGESGCMNETSPLQSYCEKHRK